MEELPEEVTFTPVPYVAFIGLGEKNNDIHCHIWNTFAINRSSDRPLLYYKQISVTDKFPLAKERKPIERHIPSGIIKRQWLPKHLIEMPSIVVIFEEGGWDLFQNPQRKQSFIAKVNSIRESLGKRQVKIIIVLLQPVTLTDDNVYKEHSVALCNECAINPKFLFMISTNDHQMITGYVLRIEHALLDLARSYYAMKAKLVKAQKDLLNRSTQIYLFVRYEFKLGFFHEIRQIYTTALEHYKNSYTTLMEIRQTSANIFEIKSVASLLNYKICKIHFYLSNPKDAIFQFKNHVDIFQNKLVSNQIEFEHYAWLSKQFRLFGDVFEMAVNFLNLAPTSNHHPGIYYFESASYMVKRRKFAQNFLPLSLQEGEDKTLQSLIDQWQRNEFIGHTLFNVEPDTENICFKALKFKEQSVDHTALIIELYGYVLDYYKKFKKLRFKNHVMFLIGEEYYNLSNYAEALGYFTEILPFYREQKWDSLYYKVAQLAVNTAFLTTDLSNFIKCAFESITNDSMTESEKLKLLNCIFTLLNLQSTPLQLFDPCDQQYNQYMEQRWSEAIGNVIQKKCVNEIAINMDRGMRFLKCKLAFSASSYLIEDSITITVLVYSHLLLDVPNTSLILKFQNSFHDRLCTLRGEQNPVLRGNSLNTFQFELRPLVDDIGKEMQISEFIIRIGPKLFVSFHWNLTKRSKFPKTLFAPSTSAGMNTFGKFRDQLTAQILEHKSKLSVEINKADLLFVNEFAVLDLSIKSGEKYPVSNLKFELKIVNRDGNADDADGYKLFVAQNEVLSEIVEKHCLSTSLAPGGTLKQCLVLKLLSPGVKSIEVDFTYDLLFESGPKTHFILVNKRLSCEVKCVELLATTTVISNYGCQETANIRVAEPFRLRLDAQPVSGDLKDLIQIEQIVPYFAANINVLSSLSTELGQQFAHNHRSEAYLLSTLVESSTTPYSLGYFNVRWRRKCDSYSTNVPESLLVSETAFQMPTITITPSVVFVELRLPERNYAREPFMAKYVIHNRLDVDIVVEASMSTSDCILISGNKLIKMLISAKQFVEQSYIFYSLRCGTFLLPTFELSIQLPGQNPIAVDYVNQMITPTITILPQKSNNIVTTDHENVSRPVDVPIA